MDLVIAHLMQNGLKVEGGDRLGKTIIFAKNEDHAKYIEQRFNLAYPDRALVALGGSGALGLENAVDFFFDVRQLGLGVGLARPCGSKHDHRRDRKKRIASDELAIHPANAVREHRRDRS